MTRQGLLNFNVLDRAKSRLGWEAYMAADHEDRTTVTIQLAADRATANDAHAAADAVGDACMTNGAWIIYEQDAEDPTCLSVTVRPPRTPVYTMSAPVIMPV